MPQSIRNKIIRSLAKDAVLDEVQDIAQEVQLLHFELVQALSCFTRICGHLVHIKQQYGQEAYEACLEVLTLDPDQVEMIMDHINGIKSLPENVYQKTLYSLAFKTVNTLGLDEK